MTTLIAIYLAVGFFSYWPLVFHYKICGSWNLARWYEWLAAWLAWTLCWPARYIADAWYWLRAKK